MKKEVLSPGKVLRDLVQKYQISISQLAKDVDITPSGLNQIANGKNRITVSIGLKLAKYFGLAENYLIDLQLQYDILEMKKDSEIAASLKGIKTAKIPAKKSSEATQKRGSKPKDGTPVEATPPRRSKVKKTDKSVTEAEPLKTKMPKAGEPKRPAKASEKREVQPAKEPAKAPKEAKGTRLSTAAKPEQPIKEVKAKAPVVKEKEAEKPEKTIKPPRKPPKAENTHILPDSQIDRSDTSFQGPDNPEPEIHGLGEALDDTSIKESGDFEFKNDIPDEFHENTMDNSEDIDPDDSGATTRELEFGEDIKSEALPEEENEK
jgi:addiction module HigA family antidote